ncbi:MAG: M23 family metallopeptidase [Pseudomonadota bacterium]
MFLYTLTLSVFLWTGFASVKYFTHNKTVDARVAQYQALLTAYAQVSAEKSDLQKRLEKAAASPLSSGDSLENAMAPQEMRQTPAREDLTLMLQPRPRVLTNPVPRGRVSLEAGPKPRPAQPTPKPQPDAPPAFGNLDRPVAAQKLRPVENDLNDALLGEAQTFVVADVGAAIRNLEKLINQTGLNADAILRRRTPTHTGGEEGGASGGPLLSLPPTMIRTFTTDRAREASLESSARLSRLEMLREALFSLPLAEPVDKYYISSGFGYRKDPFTRERAFHSGADLVAPHGDPVRSSAPGMIIFAGYNGPYGNMVEIDHGNGVKSRYGHMSRLAVSKGQKVGLRDVIGYVGNTGRSGTAHLHFEVWFDGKPRNPLNFLKAGENVFQRQG